MLRRCCFHVLYHLNHSPVGHLLLDLLQLCLCVGGRQQDVKTAVSCEGKPRHLLAKKDKKILEVLISDERDHYETICLHHWHLK